MSEQELTVRPQTEIENTCQHKLLDVLGRYKKTIDAVVGGFLDSKRFAWLVVSAVRANPRLAECSPASFLNSVMLATQMGVEIRRDSAYLIPFGKECQLLIDYKAKLGLARRGGKVGGIQAVTIRQKDAFEWQYTISGVKFLHDPFKAGILSPEERGDIVGVYAFAQLTEGGMQFREPMSLSEIDRIRKRSHAGVSSMSLDQIFKAHEFTADGKQMEWQTWQYKDPRRQPWVTDFEAMALKTVLHSLYKSIPLEAAASLSQEVDEGFETGKQPNILGDAVNVDPVDEQPMITASVEEQESVMQDKLAQGRQDAAAKKAERKATPKPAAQPAPAERPVAKDYDDFPDAFEFQPGAKIYVKGILHAANEDLTGWNRVVQ